MNRGTKGHKTIIEQAALANALQRLLRPLVRLLLRYQITYPYLTGLLKSIYVEIAARELGREDEKLTDSRLTVMTGVHRKDVKRLREAPTVDTEAPASVSLGAQLVARWTGVPEFLDTNERPRPLPRLARDADGPSFERLVESVSKDIRPRAVLDEWLRLGVAHIDEEDRVCLNTEAFIPEKGFEERIFYLGKNVHDHLAACTHNLTQDGAPFLERSVYYDKLSRESARELQAFARELGVDALQQINRRAMQLQNRDQQQPDATQRITFGVYWYTEAAGSIKEEN